METTYKCQKCSMRHSVNLRHGYRHNGVSSNRTNLTGTPVKSAIVCGILVMMLLSSVASAAHTYDTRAKTPGSSSSTTPNPRNVSYTAGNGATLMVVSIFVSDGSVTRTGGAPTFNGKTLTAVYNTVPGYASYESYPEMWYLLLTSDDTGSSHTVSVPNTGSAAIQVQVATYKSATGMSALDGSPVTKIATNGADPSASITTTGDGDVIVSALGDGTNSAPSAVNVGTAMYRNDAGSYSASTSYYLQSTAGTQAITWTVSNANHVLVVAAFKEVNPVPTTVSISPNSKNAGDSGFTMTVTGTNFVSGSTVRIDGSDRVTTFVSSTSLTVAILTSDMASAGTHSITVFNPTPGGGTSNAQTFTVNNLVPTTVSISPNSKYVGDSGFTMTVTGTNFVSGSTVRIDGSDRVTTYVSSISLTAAILTSDMASAGTHSITVFNPTPGGGTSNAQMLTVTMYSLNNTYTFIETNLSTTWQSIRIKDSSYGDPLTNVSIFNATSGIWESILTTPFTGGTSPVEHVNVIMGASGNASNYDAGGGQIKIRYNWTDSLSNNNLGIDMINVTVFYYNATYFLNLTTNITTVPESSSSELQLKYYVSGDNFTVQIMNISSGWENASILNDTSMSYRNIPLSSNWLIPNGMLSGNVSSINIFDVFVRYLGIDQNVNGTIYLDYQRVYSS